MTQTCRLNIPGNHGTFGIGTIQGVGKSFDQFDYSSFVDAPLCSYLVACCFPTNPNPSLEWFGGWDPIPSSGYLRIVLDSEGFGHFEAGVCWVVRWFI